MILTDLLFVIVGLVGLVFGGTWLVNGAAALASAFGVPTLIIGLTIVALGTSAPELLVSLSAAASGYSDVAIGNVIGSNIGNIGLILAISALIAPLSIDWKILRRELFLLLAVTVAVVLMALDGEISRVDGLILFGTFAVYIIIMIRSGLRERAVIEPEVRGMEEIVALPPKPNKIVEAIRLLIGLVVLILGAQALVAGATSIARAFGVPDLIIGITLVAIGTSLPELATCVYASLKRQNDIVMGNVIGSNIANIMVILALTAIILPVATNQPNAGFGYAVMILFTCLMLPLAVRQVLGRAVGMVFLLGYAAFLVISVVG